MRLRESEKEKPLKVKKDRKPIFKPWMLTVSAWLMVGFFIEFIMWKVTHNWHVSAFTDINIAILGFILVIAAVVISIVVDNYYVEKKRKAY